MPQGYRNARTGYLTDLLVDTTPVGSIVPNLKAGRNSKDHFEKPDSTATYPKLVETSGNAYLNSDDPAYFGGYLNMNLIQVQSALNLTKDDVKILIINS